MSKLLDSGGRILVATGPLLAQTLSRVYSLVLGACALALPRPDMYVTLLGGRSARRLVAAGPNYPPVEIWAVPSPPRLWGCGVIGNARLGYLVGNRGVAHLNRGGIIAHVWRTASGGLR